MKDAGRALIALVFAVRLDAALVLQALLQTVAGLLGTSLRVTAGIDASVVGLLGLAPANDRTWRRRRVNAALIV